MTNRFLSTTAILTLLLGVATYANAGQYGLQDFTFANGTTNLGDGSTMSQTPAGTVIGVYDNSLRLSQNTIMGINSSFKLPDLDPGQSVNGFTATFDISLFDDSGDPADGFSFDFGNLPAGNGGGETGFFASGGQGLTVGFDSYAFADGRETEVWVNGVSVGLNETDVYAFDNTVAPVTIHWDVDGLDVNYNGTQLFTDLDVSGLNPQPGWQFGFSARTGGATQEVRLDNLQINTSVPEPYALSIWLTLGLGIIGFAYYRSRRKT